MPENDQPSEEPRIGEPPPYADPQRLPSFVIAGSRNLHSALGPGRTADLLRSSLTRMSAAGPAAETDYQESLGAVRSRPVAEVKALIAQGIRALPEAAYLDRWALVQLGSDMRRPELVELFDDVIGTPIPAERSSGADHRSSTVARELLIRTSAVEGLARLAADGSADATQALLRHVSHENHTVRAACVLGLKELGTETAARVQAAVAEQDQDLLDIYRADVRDVPPPAAGDFVRRPGTRDNPPPPR